MTAEQAYQIAHFAFDSDELIKSDMKFHYQPYDIGWQDDAREFIAVDFKGALFGDKAYPVTLEITPQLNCWMHYVDPAKTKTQGYKLAERLPVRNQYAIQAKFREWGFEPDYKERTIKESVEDSKLKE